MSHGVLDVARDKLYQMIDAVVISEVLPNAGIGAMRLG